MQDSKKGARGVSTSTALYSSAGVLGENERVQETSGRFQRDYKKAPKRLQGV